MQNPFNTPPKVDQNNVAITGGTIDNVAITSSSVTGGTTAPSAFIMPEGTPVNAVAASGTVAFTGLPNVFVPSAFSTGTITVSGTPVAEETFVVGTQTFTFKVARSAAGEVTIDADNTQQAINIVAAITLDIPTEATATNLAGVVTVTAFTTGVAGDAVTLTENATGIAVSAGGTLTGGVDEVLETVTIGAQVFTFVTLRAGAGEVTVGGDASDTGDNLVTAMTADITDVVGVNNAGVVTLTATTAGAAGNSIALAEDATSTAVGAAALAGGVDGTAAPANTTFADGSYYYHTPVANTIADANWVKIPMTTATDAETITGTAVDRVLTPANLTAKLGDINALLYKGVIDCSANPNYPAADAGFVYVISVAGKIGGVAGVVVVAGDIIICKTDSTVTGDHATVGTNWNVIEKNIDLTNIVISGGSIDGTTIGGGTAGTVRMLYDEDVEAATDTLSANQCANGQISNYGQSADTILTLPACAAGMSFTFVAGSTAAFYLRIDPDANDLIVLDGIPGANGKYVGLTTVTQGDWIHFRAFQSGAGAYDWLATQGIGAWSAET